MGWSWEQLIETPQVVVQAVIEDMAAQSKAAEIKSNWPEK